MRHNRLMRSGGILTTLLLVSALPAFSADWNKQRAADYLDARAKAWSEWSVARSPGGTCVSCHTNLTYLIARPALTRALKQPSRAPAETGLLDGLRFRMHQDPPQSMFAYKKEPAVTQAAGVNAILTALCLAIEDAGKPQLSPDTRTAFDRMWDMQLLDGDARGAWDWFTLDLDPWEMPDSAFYGASMAALAVGQTPPAYRNQPEVRLRISALSGYLAHTAAAQPLHNRLAQLWAASKLPEVMSPDAKQATIGETWRKQQSDGSWTMDSLGPFAPHAAAPPNTGNRAYATAWAAFTLERGGVSAKDARLARALSWLKANQDSAGGYWDGQSMNKVYPEGAMQLGFIRDAATAYASLALLGAE